MKILVCISKTPDTAAKIAFTDNNTKFKTEGVQFILNPSDEWYALVRGLELKEQTSGTVTVVNVGKAENDSVIRKALAIGADDAVRIDTEPGDAFSVATQLTAFAKEGDYDMILLGKETINYNGSQVAGMLSEMMNLPFISSASKMDVEGTTATIERDVEGGEEVIEAETPFVISCAKGMAEARIPNMRGIMAARKKPLKVVDPVDVEQQTEIEGYSLPKEKGECHYIDAEHPEELIKLLHEEEKLF